MISHLEIHNNSHNPTELQRSGVGEGAQGEAMGGVMGRVMGRTFFVT